MEMHNKKVEVLSDGLLFFCNRIGQEIRVPFGDACFSASNNQYRSGGAVEASFECACGRNHDVKLDS